MAVLTKIKSSNIADDAITTDKIADSTGSSDGVTTAKIASVAVTAAKVAADVATQAELDASGVPGITSTGASATHMVTVAGNLTVGGSYIKTPSVDTAARDALTPAIGMLIYNTTIGMLQQYNAAGWASIDSPPTVSSLNYPGDDTALDTVGEFNDATCDYNNDPTIAHDTNSNMKVGMSVSGTGIPVGATIASVTSTTAFELSASTTGGAVTNGTLTFNTQTLVIAGTNFQTGATVTIDGTAPSTVTRNSSTQITVTGTPAKTAGTKVDGLVVSNASGLSASINVDYSALPAWVTASGNILSDYIGETITEIDLDATNATSYAITSGALPGGLSMATGDGDITGTISGSAATYNFTVTATDAEAQSAPRAFNIIVSTMATGGNQIRTYQHGGTGTIYRVHIFTAVGVHTLETFETYTMDIFILGGGGGGGNGFGGGGGGGAILYRAGYSRNTGTFPIVVGAGAAAQTITDQGGHYGLPSSFNDGTIIPTALGGGGGSGEGGAPQGANTNWGNAGGNKYSDSTPNTTGTHTTYTGYTLKAGEPGAGGGGSSPNYPSGGGASPNAGSNAVASSSAQGGPGADGFVLIWAAGEGPTPRLFGQAGTHNNITLDNGYYWGGGGGGSSYNAAGGAGPGGRGGGGGGASNTYGNDLGATGAAGGYGWNTGAPGIRGEGSTGVGGDGGDNTGAGGGGGTESDGDGGAGGSGIVIIRYAI